MSFCVTRGPDGQLKMFLILSVVLALGYLIAMPFSFRSKWTLHSLGHLLVFLGAGIVAYLPEPKLKEMAGTLYLLVPLGITVTIALGAVVLLCVGSARKVHVK